MEQVSFRMLDTWEDTFLKLKKDLEFLFNSKLSGDDMLIGSIQGDKMVTVIDDRSTNLTYSPAVTTSSTDAWYQFDNDFFYYDNTVTRGNGDHASTQTVEWTFEGTEAQVIGAKGPDCGRVKIYIDGTLQATVDCYSANYIARVNLYEKTGLSQGQHVIKLEVDTVANVSATNKYFYFDAFRINTPIGLKQVEIGVQQVSVSVATSTDGWAYTDLLNYSPDGYSSLGIAGVTLISPDPSTTSANKPKIGWDGRIVKFWDGPLADTIQARVFFIVARK